MPEASDESAIEIMQVSKRYQGQVALDALDLTVESGEGLALIGHNGAGKTTLLKLVLGLTHPDEGSIRVRGLSPEHITNRQTVAFLPETVNFPPALSGRELIRFYARMKQRPLRECDELLELVGLTHAATRRVVTYSKGMRQRLGLAQALLGKPQLILLDEPTSGLDPSLRKQFYNIIDNCRANGSTVMISSHALSEIESRVDRIAILRHGRLVIHGSLAELRRATNLPVQIRVTTAQGGTSVLSNRLKPDTHWRQINNHCVEFECRPAEKLGVLQELSSIPSGIVDIEILPPKLDELYIHFAGEESRP